MMKRKLISGLLAGCVLTLAGCNAGKDQTNIENFQGHFDQVSVKAQDWDPKMGMDAGMRVPPENTVPRGYKVYPYLDPEKAGKELKNPLAGDFSPAVLERGKNRYDIYCAVCHGTKGLGDGPVAAKYSFSKPPELVSDKVKNFRDGRIYHIIVKGQGLMGSYSRQIMDLNDRWAIVNYVRNLQGKNE